MTMQKESLSFTYKYSIILFLILGKQCLQNCLINKMIQVLKNILLRAQVSAHDRRSTVTCLQSIVENLTHRG